MSEFVTVAKRQDFADPGSLLFEVGDRLVVVVRIGNDFFALDDVCTHDGGPLSDGELDAQERTIACPRHGAKFALQDGAALTMPATKPTVAHDVQVVDDEVAVRLRDS